VPTYALSLLVLAGAVLLRWLLDPLMGNSLPLVTLFGAVAGAVWVGGYRPALLVALTGYVACHYLFIEPRGAFVFDAGIVAGVLAYLFTCALIIGIGEAMRHAQTHARARGEVLGVTLGSIGDAVITTDTEGLVTFLNRAAESLTGWTHDDARGRPLADVFRIINEELARDRREPGHPSPSPGRRRGIGQPHAAHRERRGGTADRRQRRTDQGRTRCGVRVRADLPRRVRTAAVGKTRGGAAS
jgi:PAS domain-containing protein